MAWHIPVRVTGRWRRSRSPVAAGYPYNRYGWDRIVAGARFLSDFHPYWWQEGALLPASLAALDMADPYRCVLAWWAAWYLPAPPRRGPRQVPPYDRAVRALRLSSLQAEALGFTGIDADLLTAGWRHLITCLRASHDRPAALDAELEAPWHPTWDTSQSAFISAFKREAAPLPLPVPSARCIAGPL